MEPHGIALAARRWLVGLVLSFAAAHFACSGSFDATRDSSDASASDGAPDDASIKVVVVDPGLEDSTAPPDGPPVVQGGASEAGADAPAADGVSTSADAAQEAQPACSPGAPCTAPNAAVSACDAHGTCLASQCQAGFLDCDGDKSNGCETEFNTLDCGACGTFCNPAHVLHATCSSSSPRCQYDACDGAYFDCDGDMSNGCETECAPAHATGAMCSGGGCGYAACATGYLDCDGVGANGCETACAPANVVAPACSSGGCGYTACAQGFLDCDGNKSNGCETPFSLSNCGGCGTLCQPANVKSAVCFTTGQCSYTSCAAFDQYGNSYMDCDTSTSNGCESAPNSESSCGSCTPCPTSAYTCEMRIPPNWICKND